MCSDGWFIGFNYVSFSTKKTGYSWVFSGRDAKISSFKNGWHKAQKPPQSAEDMAEHCFFKKMVAKIAWHTDFDKLTMELRHVENPCALW